MGAAQWDLHSFLLILLPIIPSSLHTLAACTQTHVRTHVRARAPLCALFKCWCLMIILHNDYHLFPQLLILGLCCDCGLALAAASIVLWLRTAVSGRVVLTLTDGEEEGWPTMFSTVGSNHRCLLHFVSEVIEKFHKSKTHRSNWIKVLHYAKRFILHLSFSNLCLCPGIQTQSAEKFRYSFLLSGLTFHRDTNVAVDVLVPSKHTKV